MPETRANVVEEMGFAVEIECGIPHDSLQSNGWTIDGYHAHARGNSTPIPEFPGWGCENDSSVHFTTKRGAEVISPVLRGAEGMLEVARMLTKLRSMGAKVNQTCGLHVNVSWNGNISRIKRLITLVARYEQGLFAMSGTPARETGGWGRTIKERYRGMIIGNNAVKNVRELVNRHQSRYHVLNLAHVNGPIRKRRVEFRCFAGTLKEIKVLAYIMVCLGMVQNARTANGKRPQWDMAKGLADAKWPDGSFALRKLLYSCLHWFPRKPEAALGVVEANRSKVRPMVKELYRLAHKYDVAKHDPAVDAGFTRPYTSF
jgi:hypothetical protein